MVHILLIKFAHKKFLPYIVRTNKYSVIVKNGFQSGPMFSVSFTMPVVTNLYEALRIRPRIASTAHCSHSSSLHSLETAHKYVAQTRKCPQSVCCVS